MVTRKAADAFECDVVGEEFCDWELRRDWGFVETVPGGTVVRWDLIRTFPSGLDPSVTARFVQHATTRLQQHLGMVFHRFIEQGRIKIGIDVQDVALLGSGPVVEVKALDPFGYLRAGAGGYPKNLRTTVEATAVAAVCHIWPARSQVPEFRLPGPAPEHFQGLYFYRRDRLLQAGGRNNVEVHQRDLQLARVAVDLDDALVRSRRFTMNPEKSRMECGPEFGDALSRAAADDGNTFKTFVDTARQAFKQSNRRRHARTPVVPVGRGLPPTLRRVAERELAFLPGYERVDLRWRVFKDDTFLDVDREGNTIWLNSRYRSVVVGDAYGTFNHAPLVKIHLFLLTENLFHGAWWGAKDKDNLELWQTLLTTAVKEQLE